MPQQACNGKVMEPLLSATQRRRSIPYRDSNGGSCQRHAAKAALSRGLPQASPADRPCSPSQEQAHSAPKSPQDRKLGELGEAGPPLQLRHLGCELQLLPRTRHGGRPRQWTARPTVLSRHPSQPPGPVQQLMRAGVITTGDERCVCDRIGGRSGARMAFSHVADGSLP